MDPLTQGQDSLELFDFGVLLQALSSNLKVGVLVVRSGNREKFLHLSGETLQCVYARKPRVTLQKVLFNHRAVELGPLRLAADELGPKRTDDDLAVWLVERGCVTPEQVVRARRYQVVEEVLELFYWKSVGFEFYAETQPGWSDCVTGSDVVPVGDPMPIDDVLAMCSKTIEDIAKFNSVTPSLRDVYELQFASLQELERAVPDPAEREFMLLIDGLRDMREVLADMRMNRFEVLELFYDFRTAGRIRPKNAFELLMLAENRRQDFSWEKRMRVLERVNELGVEGFGVLLPLAETYEALGKSRKAADAFSRHARLAEQANELESALDSAMRAVELAGDEPEHHRLVIELLERSGRSGDATAAYRALGTILRERGDVDGACRAFESALRLAGHDADIRRALGEALAERGDARHGALRMRQAGDLHMRNDGAMRAVDCYERTLVMHPRAWNTRLRLIDAHRAAGRHDLAVQVLSDHVAHVSQGLSEMGAEFCTRRLLDAESKLRVIGGFASSAARHLGEAYRRLDRTEDAARALREGATSLLAARRPSSAVELCADLIDLCPDDLKARRIAAGCHAALGDHNQALVHLRRVTVQLIRNGAWDEAAEVFEEMLVVDPASLDGQIGLARALLHGSRGEEAVPHFLRAGLLHRGCGRAHEALPVFREAVHKRPGDVDLLAEHCELLLAARAYIDDAEIVSALAAVVELRMARNEHAEAAVCLARLLELEPEHAAARDILAEVGRALVAQAAQTSTIDVGASTSAGS